MFLEYLAIINHSTNISIMQGVMGANMFGKKHLRKKHVFGNDGNVEIDKYQDAISKTKLYTTQHISLLL